MIKTLPMNHMDMEHKWCKNGPKTPQNYIVHPMLVPVVSYFISYPAFKCLQYHPMPQTCVWTVIGDQNPTYEPYESAALGLDGAGGLGAGKTSGAGTQGVDLNAAIGGRTGDSNTNGGESSNNGSKIHVECYPAENPSL